LFLKIFGIGVRQFLFQKCAFSFLSPAFTRFKDNMHIYRWLSPFILVFILCLGCDKPLPTLEGVDLARWQEDRNACKNVRAFMRDAIDREKEKLLALTQMQIVELLGRPDQNELYSRNQKFFYYFLEPAPACTGSQDSAADKLVIRFNAMGLAKEVSVE
jgi:outer membrane protein assembly factor BamE (lipoprotein component of BamABCDE complex)